MTEPVSQSRLNELAQTLADAGRYELGPLDRQDLRTALVELLERRKQDREAAW